MSNKHIKDDDSGLRHFSRHVTGACKGTDGNCDYENRFVGPLAPPATFPKHGFGRHHILPVSSVGKFETFDAYSATDRDQIRGVYRQTEWCTSRASNLIVLPLKTEYARSNAKYVGIRALNLPCHDVDHGCARGYTDEVTATVEIRVWQKFKKAADKGHPTAEDVAKVLAQTETDFRNKLIQRGLRNNGTKAALDALQSKSHNAQTAKAGQWWLPFSMAKDNIAKQRVLLSLGTCPDWLSVKIRRRYPK